MEKGYYYICCNIIYVISIVAIHNKNGKGLLLKATKAGLNMGAKVAIHNKNGKGLLLSKQLRPAEWHLWSQSTIKMEKGYYKNPLTSLKQCLISRNPQ